MNIVKHIINSVDAYFDYVAKARAVVELSQLSDRELMDIGVSRDQLNVKVTGLWAANKADAAKTDSVRKPVKAPKFDFGSKLASMYSNRNSVGHIV